MLPKYNYFSIIKGLYGLLIKYKNIFLVISSITYFSGYFLWCLIGWLNNFGTIPALDIQYFLSGSVFLIFIAFLFFLMYSIYFFLDKFLPNFLKSLSVDRRFNIMMIFTIPLVLVMLFDPYFTHFSNYKTYILGFYIAVLLIMFRSHASPEELKSIESFIIYPIEFLNRIFVFGVPLLLGAVFLLNFLTEYYFIIPQSFGGAKPICATFDINSEQFSPETLKRLNNLNKISSKIFQTQKLNVIFLSNNHLIVKIDKDFNIILDRQDLKAVQICDPPPEFIF